MLRLNLSGVCGTDKHTFRGETAQYAGTAHERRLSYPLICGHENVGVVEAVGGEVRADDGTPLRVGDRIVPGANVACGRCWYCLAGEPYYLCEHLEDYGNSLNVSRPPSLFGGWAELMYLLPGTPLFRVPPALEDELAVLTEPMAVTHGVEAARRVLDVPFGESVVGLRRRPARAVPSPQVALRRLRRADRDRPAPLTPRRRVGPRRDARARRLGARAGRARRPREGAHGTRRRRRPRLLRRPGDVPDGAAAGKAGRCGRRVRRVRRPRPGAGQPEPRHLHAERDGDRDRRRAGDGVRSVAPPARGESRTAAGRAHRDAPAAARGRAHGARRLGGRRGDEGRARPASLVRYASRS